MFPHPKVVFLCHSSLDGEFSNSIKSAWVKRELTFALKQRRYNDTIVPVILQLCDYEQFFWTLSSHQVVDFTVDYDIGARALLRIWGIDYQPIDPAA